MENYNTQSEPTDFSDLIPQQQPPARPVPAWVARVQAARRAQGDIFDQIAPDNAPAQPQGDIFDQIAPDAPSAPKAQAVPAPAQPQGDIFDQIAPDAPQAALPQATSPQAAPQGDIFDQIAPDQPAQTSQPQGDIFDQIAPDQPKGSLPDDPQAMERLREITGDTSSAVPLSAPTQDPGSVPKDTAGGYIGTKVEKSALDTAQAVGEGLQRWGQGAQKVADQQQASGQAPDPLVGKVLAPLAEWLGTKIKNAVSAPEEDVKQTLDTPEYKEAEQSHVFSSDLWKRPGAVALGLAGDAASLGTKVAMGGIVGKVLGLLGVGAEASGTVGMGTVFSADAGKDVKDAWLAKSPEEAAKDPDYAAAYAAAVKMGMSDSVAHSTAISAVAESKAQQARVLALGEQVTTLGTAGVAAKFWEDIGPKFLWDSANKAMAGMGDAARRTLGKMFSAEYVMLPYQAITNVMSGRPWYDGMDNSAIVNAAFGAADAIGAHREDGSVLPKPNAAPDGSPVEKPTPQVAPEQTSGTKPAEVPEAQPGSTPQKPGGPDVKQVENPSTMADSEARLSSKSREVPDFIKRAAEAVPGTDPEYLAKIMGAESSGNVNAKNPDSTASGLWQFLDSTWKELVGQYGQQYGLTLDGKNDPQQQAIAMALFTKDNQEHLQKAFPDRQISEGDLYMAHFLGKGGAVEFLRTMDKSPDTLAQDVIPKRAVEANHSVFFDRDGTPRTVQQVYDLMAGRMEKAGGNGQGGQGGGIISIGAPKQSPFGGFHLGLPADFDPFPEGREQPGKSSLPNTLEAAQAFVPHGDQAPAVESAKQEPGKLTEDQPAPESQKTIDAQMAAITDPRSAKDAMLVTPGSPMPADIPDNIIRVETPRGTVLTTNQEAASAIKADPSIATMGKYIVGVDGGKPLDATHVVQALDEHGTPVSEVATNKAGQIKAVIAMREHSPLGQTRTIPIEQALSEREAARKSELAQGDIPQAPAVPTVEELGRKSWRELIGEAKSQGLPTSKRSKANLVKQLADHYEKNAGFYDEDKVNQRYAQGLAAAKESGAEKFPSMDELAKSNPMYQRKDTATNPSPGMSKQDMDSVVSRSKAKGLFETVQSPEDLPQALYEHMRDNDDLHNPAVFWNGKMWFIGDNATGPKDLLQSIAHELTHSSEPAYVKQLAFRMGGDVRATLDKFNQVKHQIYLAHAKEIHRLYKSPEDGGHGYNKDFDISTDAGRMGLVSELLAHKAETFEPKWHDRAVAAVRDLVRAIQKALGLKEMEFSDTDIRALLAKMAKAGGEEANTTGSDGSPEPAYQRRGLPGKDDNLPGKYDEDMKDNNIHDGDFSKPTIWNSKEKRAAAKEDLYQKWVDNFSPIVTRAKEITPELGHYMEQEVARLRGVNGTYERQLAGDGLSTWWKEDATQKIPGSKSLAEIIEPIKGDKDAYDLLRLRGKNEREWALGTYRPEYPKGEFLKNVSELKALRSEAVTHGDKDTIAWVDHQLDVEKRAVDRQVKHVDADMAQVNLEDLQMKAGPEEWDRVGKVLSDLRRFSHDAILKPMLDAGVLSKERYDSIVYAPEHAWYIPFQRVLDQTERQSMGTKKVIEQIRGSEKALADPIAATMANLQRAVRLVNQNRVAKDFIDVAKAHPDLKDIITPIEVPHGSRFDPNQAIAVHDNGKVTYYSAPEKYLKAVNGLTPTESNLMLQLLRIPAKALRYGATLSPEFMVRHLIRSQYLAWIHSDNGFVPFLDAFRGLGHMLSNSDKYQEWMAAGGGGNVVNAMDLESKTTEANKLLGIHKKGVVEWCKTPIEAMEKMATYIDSSTRMGEYMKALQNGKTPMDAALSSKDVALDFARAGTHGRILNQLATFWNANVQDMDKLQRTLRDPEKRGAALLKTALGLTLPAIALALLQKDDEVYQGLSDAEKNLFFNFVISHDPKNPVVLRVPVPFQWGMLMGSLPGRIVDYLNSHDPKALKTGVMDLFEKTNPLRVPTAMAPWLETWANKSFFSGRPIENEADKRLQPQYRADAYTSPTLAQLSKGIAGLTGGLVKISPKMTQNFIRSSLSNVGGNILDAADTLTQAVTGSKSGEAPAKHWTELYGVRSIMAPTGSNLAIDRFYENLEESRQAKGTDTYLRKKAPEDVGGFRGGNGNELSGNPVMERAAKQIAEMRKGQSAVRENPRLSADEKRAQMDDLHDKMVKIARFANAAYKATQGAAR
jgi:hypothetical protein